MEGDRAVKDMQREPQRLAVKTLREHEGLRMSLLEVIGNERCWTRIGRGFPRQLTINIDYLWTFYSKRLVSHPKLSTKPDQTHLGLEQKESQRPSSLPALPAASELQHATSAACSVQPYTPSCGAASPTYRIGFHRRYTKVG